MKLYIMRHGPAEDDSPTGRDANRALTKSGRARVHAVAQSLVDHDEAPLAILSSPLVRAFQTAQVVSAVIEFAARVRAENNSQSSVAASVTSSVEMCPELGPGLDAIGLVSDLVRAERKRVMIVGHEPDLGMLVTRLVGESHIAHIESGLLKAMVIGIKLTPTAKASGVGFTSKFRFVLHPKTLAWLA
ncbi:MAG: histidine phosphatase family protein [Polyangiaceae bacterium]|nr:histidine phosphatase family protein [Polyangiaceae bacterium]